MTPGGAQSGSDQVDERAKASLRAFGRLLGGTGGTGSQAPFPPVLELASAGAIFVTDAVQRIVYANSRAAALAWSPTESVLGRTCRDVFRCANCPPQCPLRGGVGPTAREVVLRARDGRDVPLLKHAELLLDGAGVPVGAVDVMHDLSPIRGVEADRCDAPRGLQCLAWDAARHGMVGSSPAMRSLFGRVQRLAQVDAAVLITGESGAGKELVARALHDAGPRAARPFHAINCAALPAELLESELFGHERGAFSGAVRDKPGRFELCEDGTLLLDEIGCLPYALQAKLLRVLEDGRFERVGGTRTLQLRARVVAATNADLDARAREGSFRADLLYRLKVCPVAIPPLRDRREDIAAIAKHFAEKLSASLGGRTAGITPEAMAALERYPWPGNVRELRNVVHSALVVAMDVPIGLEHLPSEIAGPAGPAALDRARIEEALARARFNRSEAAMLLGVSRTTLWRQMRRAGLR